jgi:hypothetical protein
MFFIISFGLQIQDSQWCDTIHNNISCMFLLEIDLEIDLVC